MDPIHKDERFVTAADMAAEHDPAGWLWLFYLYFRPASFFRSFVIESTPGLTALCAWFYGMSGVIDQIGGRTMADPGLLQNFNWVSMWVLILIGGAIAGFIYFGVGGWWYRVRLGWCGAPGADQALARRVYVFASMTWALPMLLTQLVETAAYDSPYQAGVAEGSWWYLALMIFPFWSAWVSYRGVRTAFDTRRGAAFLWFLGLPSILYGLGIAAMLAAFFIMSWMAPADLAHPLNYDGGSNFTFAYPGNWWINTDDEEYDLDNHVPVEPFQNALIRLMYHESDQDPAVQLEHSLLSYQADLSGMTPISEFASWGSMHGVGRRFKAQHDDGTFVVNLFVAQAKAGHLFEVHEVCMESDISQVEPGFDLIRSTCRLK